MARQAKPEPGALLIDLCPASRMSRWQQLGWPLLVRWWRFVGWYNS
jgi:hypothetical protein